ncbi:MAG TPA: YihY/virulence factor BrkB family protein [Dermatophilaceae bacterium]|nr:YihY/virulence factor BrkB family protein [Dermatophilaceae bacterium]
MDARGWLRSRLAGVPGGLAVARLTAETVRVCMRYRVTGLASEAGFFALLSLPPLLFGLFGGVGYVGRWLGPDTVAQVSEAIQRYAARFLTDDAVRQVIVPTVDDVLRDGRTDVISIGLLLSVWSGSRALNVFVDTISIMYGQSGVRGILRTRMLSLSLYLVSVLIGGLVIPLVLIGPSLLSELLPSRVQFLAGLYWPVVVLASTASVTTLFHISTPRRTPWVRDIPGAVLTLVIWVGSSYFLRAYVGASVGGASTSIYGPLAAPIVVLIWLYFLAIAVLIGAALNAATRHLWPAQESPSARARLLEWAREEAVRRRSGARPQPLTPMPEGVYDQPSEEELAEVLEGSRRLDSGRPDRLLSVRTPGG